MLLYLLICCNVHGKKQNKIRIILENSFQYELTYMYNFRCY
jgi:hypothetical protein